MQACISEAPLEEVHPLGATVVHQRLPPPVRPWLSYPGYHTLVRILVIIHWSESGLLANGQAPLGCFSFTSNIERRLAARLLGCLAA